MSWFRRLLPLRIRTEAVTKKGVPEGLWSKCDKCASILYRIELERNLEVCPKCDYHMRISARPRLQWFLDKSSLVEIGSNILTYDRLKFRDLKKYRDRLSAAKKDSRETEALVVFAGKLLGLPVVAAAFEFRFMAGSMGSAVGERFVQGVEYAIKKKIPFICFTASGGARMQEALISLMQMAKVSAALSRLATHKLPYIAILTDPTMGGVSASLAMLGDIILAEPEALTGFAGPRVIEQTVRETLPHGFQRSEFLVKHGAIDGIVHRSQMRPRVAGLLAKLTGHQAVS